MQAVRTKTRSQVYHHLGNLRMKLERHPDHEHADILPMLQKCLIPYWSEEEHARFVAAVRLYGKDYEKIEATIGTKTRTMIHHHRDIFIKRVERDPDTKDADIVPLL